MPLILGHAYPQAMLIHKATSKSSGLSCSEDGALPCCLRNNESPLDSVLSMEPNQ